ncbi:hypothetical protein AV530_006779 [Patagioenas fasciata monilis]|uniref:Uncharacterized protein n=1 Tax=Patagioenas fasciata monilis TaxID=372326 RepID=A0A1V4KQD0_PATFA|nr:hypothetical protein AV530_006779 [Patagioenas fasciata monilis]
MADKPAWGAYAAVAIGVVAVVLAVTLPAMLCQRDTGSVVPGDTAWGATQLEEALARVAQLQEQNQVLRAELAQQQEQLGDLQIIRDRIQLENERLQKKLQGTGSEDWGGTWLWIIILGVLVWKWLR